MTTERHQAYKEAKKNLDELRGVKLHEEEYEILYDCAEGRLLTSETDSPEMEASWMLAQETLDGLVDSGRWTEQTKTRVESLLWECGVDLVTA